MKPDNHMYYSQFSQDRIINEKLVRNARGGFFTDVGAHGGILYSNTYFFESVLGWQGICVEPLESEFRKLVQNRKSININACAFSHDGTVEFHKVEDKQSPGAHSYDMLSGVAGHHTTRDRTANLKLKVDAIEMPCLRLSTLFGRFDVRAVDYLSIDTEGSEIEVLKGIDFEKVHINLIDLEHNGVREIFEGAAAILSKNGFQFAGHIQWDALFVNKTLRWTWARNRSR